MAMKIIEVTARGFNGENDDTDDRVLWCKFDSAAQAETWLDDIGAPYQSVSETSVKPHEGNADCLSHSELVAALFGFVVADMRAALDTAESFMSGFEDDDMQEGINDMLSQVRAAQGVTE